MKLLVACFLFGSTAPALLAQDVVLKSGDSASSLIELYSSEGCSSCPPAEAWLSDLKKSPDLWKTVFPVGFHVDYWDNLGWPDRFASAQFTRRQRDYASALGQDSIYTPEFIVNGKEWRPNSTLPANKAASGQLALTVNLSETKISADYSPGPEALEKSLRLHVALLGFNLVSDVKAGENRGRKLVHDFVVLGFGSSQLTAKSDGSFSAPIALKTPTADSPSAIVAWVSTDNGAILQVTGGWLSSQKNRAN